MDSIFFLRVVINNNEKQRGKKKIMMVGVWWILLRITSGPLDNIDLQQQKILYRSIVTKNLETVRYGSVPLTVRVSFLSKDTGDGWLASVWCILVLWMKVDD